MSGTYLAIAVAAAAAVVRYGIDLDGVYELDISVFRSRAVPGTIGLNISPLFSLPAWVEQ